MRRGAAEARRGLAQQEMGMRRATGRFGEDIGQVTSGLEQAGATQQQQLGQSAEMIRGSTGAFDPATGTAAYFDPYEDRVVQQTIEDAMKGAAQADIAQTARDIQTGRS